MDEILKEILSRDKSILARRDDLIKILDEKIPNNQRRTYAAFKKALTLNVGEIFLLNDLTSAEKQDRAWQILKESGMQDTKIDDVINIFVKILNLDVLPQKLKIEDRITAIEENLKLCFIDEKLLLRVKKIEDRITAIEENLKPIFSVTKKLLERVENLEINEDRIKFLQENSGKILVRTKKLEKKVEDLETEVTILNIENGVLKMRFENFSTKIEKPPAS